MGIHIELANPNRSYFAGQVVDGRVVVNNSKPDKVKEIEVTLVGTGRVHWTEQESYTVYTTRTVNGRQQRQPQHRTRTVHYHAEENYVHFKSILSGEGTLPEGNYAYPFRFMLPRHLPSSFNSHIGQVSYLVKAEVKRSLFKFNDRTRLPFTVNGIFDLNLEPGASLPQECRKIKGSNFCACRKGELNFVLNLPQRSGFVPGELLDFQAAMTNGSNRKVTGSKATLLQITNFHARGKTKTVTKMIAQANGPEVDKGEYETWSANLTIPAVPPTRLGGGCHIIDLQYYLCFDMKISGLSLSLSGKIPVLIGTIPLRNTFQIFQQTPYNNNFNMPMPQPGNAGGGPPEMGFKLPGSTAIEPIPSTSKQAELQDKYSEATGHPDAVPSAPLFQDYPDLPPPSYAEAVGAEGFTWNPEEYKASESEGITNINSDEGEAYNSQPSAPSVDEFVPNYITYNIKPLN